MSRASDRSEEALLLTPIGRDAEIAQALLAEAGVASRIYADADALCTGLEAGGGFALVTDEALHRSDISRLSAWVDAQPPWSEGWSSVGVVTMATPPPTCSRTSSASWVTVWFS